MGLSLQQVKSQELKAQTLSTIRMMHKQVLEDYEVCFCHNMLCKAICWSAFYVTLPRTFQAFSDLIMMVGQKEWHPACIKSCFNNYHKSTFVVHDLTWSNCPVKWKPKVVVSMYCIVSTFLYVILITLATGVLCLPRFVYELDYWKPYDDFTHNCLIRVG